jgi:NADH dehydrogenase
MESTAQKPRIVIVGGGFAGAYCAQALEKKLAVAEAEIVLLDRNNYFVFSPLLIEAGIGDLEPRHAVVSIRSFLRRTEFQMAEVRSVDRASQQVHYHLVGGTEPRTIFYDHLVLAMGSVPRLPAVPGLATHGYQLKSLVDGVVLRDRVIQLLEWANAIDDLTERRSLLHLVVVGANYTGVEVAGEFLAFMRTAAKKFSNLTPDDCRATLFELSGRILPTLDERLAAYAARQITRHGTTIRLEETLSRIEADHCITRSGERIEASTVIWCAGIAPPPLLAASGLPVDRAGYLRCERDFRVVDHDNLWAIGDCAANPDAEGKPYPPTAQHAVRMGPHLAANLVAVLRRRSTRPFDFTALGSLAALGGHRGVARIFGRDFSGWFAWFLWRSVYLMKMPGWGRRLRVALDWTLDLFSSRDYVQLGVHRFKFEDRPGQVVIGGVDTVPESRPGGEDNEGQEKSSGPG